MEITVVVPTFNRLQTVARTLNRLFTQDLSPDRYEIVVVVDGSTDGTASALRELRPSCHFRVIEQENRGLAGARNAGFRDACGKLILFLDDDMLCGSGLVAAHIEAHNESESAAVFGAIFLSDDSIRNLAAECFKREIGRAHIESAQTQSIRWRETDCVFSNTSLSKKLLEEFGGFDERFRVHEDMELGYRLFSSGISTKYLPNAIAYQYYDKSAVDLLLDAERFASVDVLFARKHPEAKIEGHLLWLLDSPSWKNELRALAAAHPRLFDSLLAPVCALGDSFFDVGPLRRAGVRALQLRRWIRWMHKVLELDPYALDKNKIR